MAASHLHLFQSSITDESEIYKLIVNHFLPDRVMLQWRPATGEDLPTPNTNENCGVFLLPSTRIRPPGLRLLSRTP
jgi:hypothetical protein